MVFSSTIFLFAFLPAVLAAYFLIPSRPAKNVILLAASLLFYAWGEPVYVQLMVVSIIMNWAFGFGLSKAPSALAKKTILILAVIGNLLILGYFKYEGFIAQNVNSILGTELIPDLQLPLPIGISFFTLQALSYIIDVYRGQCETQKNILYLGMYIAMFPQLVAGPIVRYSQVEHEIDHRTITLEGVAGGLRLFAVGLGKKVLLANTCAILADSLLAQSASDIGFIGCLTGVLAYTFQIYFDFSGYSDMAQGLGRMLGFNFPRNFNYPYIAKSATEFWRRWHMSLGSFFRDYLYIPLGGNRVSTLRWMLNIMIVWGVTGLWHGAAWNFILWGLYYGLLLMAEKLFLLNFLRKLPSAIQHLYCIVVFVFGWMLFSVSGASHVVEWTFGLVGRYGLLGTTNLWTLTSWEYLSLLPILIIASMPVVPWIRQKIEAWGHGTTFQGKAAPEKGYPVIPSCVLSTEGMPDGTRKNVAMALSILADIALLAIFVLSCVSIVSSSYNPFIYFQF